MAPPSLLPIKPLQQFSLHGKKHALCHLNRIAMEHNRCKGERKQLLQKINAALTHIVVEHNKCQETVFSCIERCLDSQQELYLLTFSVPWNKSMPIVFQALCFWKTWFSSKFCANFVRIWQHKVIELVQVKADRK